MLKDKIKKAWNYVRTKKCDSLDYIIIHLIGFWGVVSNVYINVGNIPGVISSITVASILGYNQCNIHLLKHGINKIKSNELERSLVEEIEEYGRN